LHLILTRPLLEKKYTIKNIGAVCREIIIELVVGNAIEEKMLVRSDYLFIDDSFSPFVPRDPVEDLLTFLQMVDDDSKSLQALFRNDGIVETSGNALNISKEHLYIHCTTRFKKDNSSPSKFLLVSLKASIGERPAFEHRIFSFWSQTYELVSWINYHANKEHYTFQMTVPLMEGEELGTELYDNMKRLTRKTQASKNNFNNNAAAILFVRSN
jgi:hypothetical protein